MKARGFSLVGNADLISTNAKSTSPTTSTPYGESSLNLGIQAQYNLALSSQFVLGFGASYERTKPTTVKNNTTAVTFKAKNLTSVFIAPGYAVSDTLLAYGKIAGQSFTEENDTTTFTRTWSGIAYGGGVQKKFGPNWFVQGELMYHDYGSLTVGTSTDKLDAFVATIGVGYKF